MKLFPFLPDLCHSIFYLLFNVVLPWTQGHSGTPCRPSPVPRTLPLCAYACGPLAAGLPPSPATRCWAGVPCPREGQARHLSSRACHPHHDNWATPEILKRLCGMQSVLNGSWERLAPVTLPAFTTAPAALGRVGRCPVLRCSGLRNMAPTLSGYQSKLRAHGGSGRREGIERRRPGWGPGFMGQRWGPETLPGSVRLRLQNT